MRSNSMYSIDLSFFFFQAEDGIRDDLVTGVQTCALPISQSRPATVPCWAPATAPTPPTSPPSTSTARSVERMKGRIRVPPSRWLTHTPHEEQILAARWHAASLA